MVERGRSLCYAVDAVSGVMVEVVNLGSARRFGKQVQVMMRGLHQFERW